MLKKITVAGLFCGAIFAAGAQSAFKTPQEAVRYYEDLVGNLTQQIRSLQDENAKLTGAVYQLQRQCKALEQTTQLHSRDIQTLRRKIDEEAEARNKQLNGIADRVQRTADKMSAPAQAAETAGDYDIYEVQPGATLTAVAKKAGISVRELKSFNHLSSDSLRVGQKLKIPRK